MTISGRRAEWVWISGVENGDGAIHAHARHGGHPMKPKQAVYVALIAAAVFVGLEAYKAKKTGGGRPMTRP